MATREKARERKLESKAGDVDHPYVMGFTIRGRRRFYFNAGDVSAFRARDAEPPGSRRRRQHNHEVLVWRTEDGELAFPGSKILRQIAEAGRGMKDPTRTGRRSAKPYIENTLIVAEELCSFGTKEWDCIAEDLVRYRNNSMGPRERPVLEQGWTLAFHVEVAEPEFVAPGDLVHLVGRAGLLGIGDNRTNGYGRFVVVKVEEPTELVW